MAWMYLSLACSESLLFGFFTAPPSASPSSPSSHTLLAKRFPVAWKCAMTAGSQALTSSVRERTLERCVPRWRCSPEHSMHMRTPRLREAQSGPAAPHSTHSPLPATWESTSRGRGSEGPGGSMREAR